MPHTSLQTYYEAQIEDILGRCTACGKCAEVCPIEPNLSLGNAEPTHLTAGVLGILRRQEPDPDAATWVQACAGSGDCIQACPEGINPRQMLSLAKNVLNSRNGPAAAARAWTTMGTQTRTLAGMQLTPAERRQVASSAGKRPARVGFWVGCNLPRTSHMVLLIVDILARMGVDCEVLGGLNNCCGIIHFAQGDSATGERIVHNLAANMQALRPEVFLSWCPTCQIQYDEFLGGYLTLGFPVRHLTTFLAQNTHLIRPRIVQAVAMRVAIHEHEGLAGVMANVREILHCVPGLEIVPIEQTSNYGYMCSRLSQATAAKTAMHRLVLDNARAAGVDALLTVYHSCHRDLAAAEADYPFAVRNFLDVLGEAMGLYREDKYKKYLLMGEAQAIVEDARPFIDMNRISMDNVLAVVEQSFVKTPKPGGKTP